MKYTLALVATLAATSAYADQGNTGLGDVGAFNNQTDGSVYTNGDTIAGDQHNSTTTQQNTYTTTNTHSTSVQNGSSAAANGYVTSVPVFGTNGTCLGSQGGAVSAAGIGISNNQTIKDEDCNTRMNEAHDANLQVQEVSLLMKQAELLNSLGLKSTAISLLCQDYTMRQSFRATLDKETYDQLCRPFHK